MFDTKGAAEYLGVSDSWIRRLLGYGTFPNAEKAGTGKTSGWQIPQADLDAYRREILDGVRKEQELRRRREFMNKLHSIYWSIPGQSHGDAAHGRMVSDLMDKYDDLFVINPDGGIKEYEIR